MDDSAPVEDALGALAADENGNATAAALAEAFPAPDGWARTATVPFSSARKWSGAAFAGHGTWVLGAPEMVWVDKPADDPVRRRADELAAAGRRVLLLAHSEQPFGGEALPGGLEAVGLVMFKEKIRPDAADTLAYFTEQGVALEGHLRRQPADGRRGGPQRRPHRCRRCRSTRVSSPRTRTRSPTCSNARPCSAG